MTRKQLAADSGLSERFLADVESGKGNVSINSLEAAARALNITILELLQDAPRPATARIQSLLADGHRWVGVVVDPEARVLGVFHDDTVERLGVLERTADERGRRDGVAVVGEQSHLRRRRVHLAHRSELQAGAPGLEIWGPYAEREEIRNREFVEKRLSGSKKVSKGMPRR